MPGRGEQLIIDPWGYLSNLVGIRGETNTELWNAIRAG